MSVGGWVALGVLAAAGALLSARVRGARVLAGAASVAVALAAGVSGCSDSHPPEPLPSSPAPAPASSRPVAGLPRPAHTVVVVMENRSYGDIIGNPAAPYINSLARRGALLTRSYAVAHPSEPNYLALFSGSTQGVASDACPLRLPGPNLASELLAAHMSFAGYSEGLPSPGSQVCAAGGYARKHAPWTNFPDVPASLNLPFRAYPSGGYARLPTVSFVIPDLCHDMHDCPVVVGDHWLSEHLSGYADWAMTHHSLLILTWDEDDGGAGNHIATILVGQQVAPGRDSRPVTHYGVLRTIEAMYGIAPTGQAASANPIEGVWR